MAPPVAVLLPLAAAAAVLGLLALPRLARVLRAAPTAAMGREVGQRSGIVQRAAPTGGL
jgi:hypothetical protein